MTNQARRIHHFCTMICLLPMILSASCQTAPIVGDQSPTQDVGEEPPSELPTAIPGIYPTITSTVAAPLQELIQGPALYPTPSTIITPWTQLVDGNSIQDLTWETYWGDLFVKASGSNWRYSFLYPTGWYESPNPSMIRGFVQNIRPTRGPATAEFVKFEIVLLETPPTIEFGQTVALSDLTTVEMAGEPGILYSAIRQVDKDRQFAVFFQYGGVWLAATGYIHLPTADVTALDQYSAIILHIMSSFDLQ